VGVQEVVAADPHPCRQDQCEKRQQRRDVSDRQRTEVEVEGVAAPRVDDANQERSQETQPQRPVDDRVQEGQRQQVEGDVLAQDRVDDAGRFGMLEESQALPLGAGASRQDQRDQGGPAEGGATGRAANARPPDPDCAQARSRAQAERDQDVGGEVNERQREAAAKQRDLQRQARREHVLQSERVVPLQLGDQPDDGAGEKEDQEGDSEQRDADPETAGRARDSKLPAFQRSAAVERIKRPVPAGHLPPKLRPKLERGRQRRNRRCRRPADCRGASGRLSAASRWDPTSSSQAGSWLASSSRQCAGSCFQSV